MLKTNSQPLPSANLLGDMPVGSLLKDTRTIYGNSPIIWQIADVNHPGYPENSVTLISYRILTCKVYDAKEPNNPTSKCKTKGNARYIWSNIRNWSNNDAPPGEWYTPQHEFDAPPVAENMDSLHNPFLEEAGFLHGFSAKFMDSMMPTTLSSINPDALGGGIDTFTDKIFLTSMAEQGAENYAEIAEGTRLALFPSYSSKIAYPTQYCVETSTYKGADLNIGSPFFWMMRSPYRLSAYETFITDFRGEDSLFYASYYKAGFRPLCNLPAQTRVSTKADTDGAYLLFA